nr:MAG TPA: hypothetical protein [Caudoviricetes sp.]
MRSTNSESSAAFSKQNFNVCKFRVIFRVIHLLF